MGAESTPKKHENLDSILMNIILTFLGTGNYQPCQYKFNDQISSEVTYFNVALASQLKADQVISLQTKTASERHGTALNAALAEQNINHQIVSIPDGKSETELWELFRALTAHIPENCTLHLDITHGFRSLPLLGFLALSYLRVTRQITIGGIHYGAWEARDAASNIAPAFDLTPFLTLLDWTSAAEQFLSTGSATRLSDLLTQTQQTLWKKPGDLPKNELPRTLKNLATCLQQSSTNLLLLRTGEFQKSSESLNQLLHSATKEADTHAAPFLEVLEPIKKQLLQYDNTDLTTLRDLVDWLAGRDQTAAALTLASEWLISYLMHHCGNQEHHTAHQQRLPYTIALSKLEQPEIEIKLDEAGQQAVQILQHVKEKLTPQTLDTLSSLSSRIRGARNDLNHAGFNDSPRSCSTLIAEAKKIADGLKKLPLE